MTTATELLVEWVLRQSPAAGRSWFVDALQRMPGATEGERGGTLALTARQLGRERLVLGQTDLAAAERARVGWRPAGQTVAQAARSVLLMATFDGDEPAFATRLLSLCRVGDLQEVIGYLRGLPVLPGAGALLEVAREGARSAIQPVFDAVALDSPYPAEVFDESGWNQMVLKSLFIGSSPTAIQGLMRRANPRLATTLVEYAQERWSAGRAVSPELWQCVGPFAGEAEIAALRRAAGSEHAAERDAAVAALRAVPLLVRQPARSCYEHNSGSNRQ